MRVKMKYILLVAVLIGAITSCKKYNDPPLVFEKEVIAPFEKERKVLIISIDGLSGIELGKYTPSNISTLLEHSKYTFDGFSDAESGDASTWTTLVSGKSHANHGIYGNTFEEELDEDDPHGHSNTNAGTGYITFFQRLIETGKQKKSFSVTPLADVDNYLFGLSDNRVVKNTDEEIKAATLDIIAKSEDNVSLGVVNFRSVNEAGVNGGFTITNAGYKAAIDKVDGYVGELLSALKARKNYSKENWLVIVTSNHGGSDKSYGGASFEERKIPIIYYNENFVKQKFEAPDLVNSLFVNKVSMGIPTMVDQSAYEIGATGEFTILSKVYVVTNGGTNSVLYGKTTHAYSSTRGWHLMTQVADKKFRYILGYGTLLYATSNKPYELNKWYTVALRVYNEGGKRYATIYQDGELVNTPVDITGRDLNAGTNRPFFIGPGHSTGTLTGGGGTAYGTSPSRINNLAFYNRALSESEIQAFNCKTDLNEQELADQTLKGYWKLQEGSGTELRNSIKTATNTNFKMNDMTLPWGLNQRWSCTASEENSSKILMNQYDIFPQLAYWLKIKTDESWKLEGSAFLNAFETEFLGK